MAKKDREIIYGYQPPSDTSYGEGKLTDLSTPEKRAKYRKERGWG